MFGAHLYQVKEKIKMLSSGQILAFYKYYPLQKEDSFWLLKNNDNDVVFVFNNTNEEIKFIETQNFTELNKVQFFYFLCKDIDQNKVLDTLIQISSLEEEDIYNISFSKSVERSSILTGFFGLEKSDFSIHPSINKILHKRFGALDCMLFYDQDKPVDIVGFDEDGFLSSEFGNNFGSNYIDADSHKLIITFSPKYLKGISLEKYCVLISKYYYNGIDLLEAIERKKIQELYFLLSDSYSKFYFLRSLMFLLSHYGTSFYNIEFSPNHKHIEASLFLKSEKEKESVLNSIQKYETDLKEKHADSPEDVWDAVQFFYRFNLKVSQSGNNYFIKLTFKNKEKLLDHMSRMILDELNSIKSFNLKILEL